MVGSLGVASTFPIKVLDLAIEIRLRNCRAKLVHELFGCRDLRRH